jgi:hypothetical protein
MTWVCMKKERRRDTGGQKVERRRKGGGKAGRGGVRAAAQATHTWAAPGWRYTLLGWQYMRLGTAPGANCKRHANDLLHLCGDSHGCHHLHHVVPRPAGIRVPHRQNDACKGGMEFGTARAGHRQRGWAQFREAECVACVEQVWLLPRCCAAGGSAGPCARSAHLRRCLGRGPAPPGSRAPRCGGSQTWRSLRYKVGSTGIAEAVQSH